MKALVFLVAVGGGWDDMGRHGTAWDGMGRHGSTRGAAWGVAWGDRMSLDVVSVGRWHGAVILALYTISFSQRWLHAIH